MADDANPPRFRKTKNGKWAVMAPVDVLEKALNEGGKVDVQRKSGDWSTFVVSSLGRPFDVDGVSMCYGYGPDDEEDGSQGNQGNGSPAPQQERRAAPSRPPRRAPSVEAPPFDPSEPLPEYQGGAEDEWDGGF